MPIHLNSVGSYEFLDLVGTIGGRQERVELFERPGVEGHGARLNKVAGVPFTLVGTRYVEDFDSAAAEYTELLDMVGTVVEVKRNTTSFGDYLILGVTEAQPPQAVYQVIGGVTAQQVTDEGLADADLEVLTVYQFALLWKADPTP